MKLDPEAKFLEVFEQIILSDEEFTKLLELCSNPPEPTDHLVQAILRSKELFE